ncbi:glycosyltransferase family 4 protein [Fibrella sp. WM1]|uniref:glycosyltransferase family 4 protein n=1 Tax=Fibrella musci TaxID=3242485 RepID=UPI003521CDE5
MIVLASILNPNCPSGVVTYYKLLQSDLEQAGHQVTLVTHDDTPLLVRRSMGGLARLMRLAGRPGEVLHNQLDHAIKLYTALRRIPAQSVELVHAQDPIAGAMAKLAYPNVPVIITCHFNDNPVAEIQAVEPVGAAGEARLERWYRWLFGKIDQFVFVSQYAYQKSAHLLPPGHRYTVIHNTVRLAGNVTVTTTERPWRITNVGFIEERKNQVYLIRLANRIKQLTSQPFEIVLIGDGPKRAEWEQLARQLSVQDIVRFVGRQPDPWRLVADSDVYVHVAHNENCPYAIIEAMAVNVPAMALPVGGIPELLPTSISHLSQSMDADAATILDVLTGKTRQLLLADQQAFFHHHLNPTASFNRLMAVYASARTPESSTTNVSWQPVEVSIVNK